MLHTLHKGQHYQIWLIILKVQQQVMLPTPKLIKFHRLGYYVNNISDEWHKIVRCCLFVTMETPKATINEHNIYDINTIFWLFDHNLKKKKKYWWINRIKMKRGINMYAEIWLWYLKCTFEKNKSHGYRYKIKYTIGSPI